MKRNLLKFNHDVVADMDGFDYNLVTEETENVKQAKKYNYRKTIDINGMGGENIDFAFNRYNKNIRTKLKDNIKIYNDKNLEIIKNLYVDGFHQYKADVADYKKYKFNLNFKYPEETEITDMDLKLYDNKRFITGWGGFDENVNVKKITQEEIKDEQKITVAETSNADNVGRFQGGFSQSQVQEQTAKESKNKEVETTKNTPLVGGFPTNLYYKNFGKSDKQSTIDVLPQKTEIDTVNHDKIEIKKKKLDFSSTFRE